MRFTHEEIHDLVGASTRISAVLSLLRDPETRDSLDPEQVDRDVRAALEKFKKTWESATARGKADI